MARTLKFHESWTIQQFKAENGCSQIQCVTNPNTGKSFFANETGKSLGAVSEAFKENPSNPVISRVQGEKGESFLMLHKKSEGNAFFVG